MSTLAAALIYIWIGMVLAISFISGPLTHHTSAVDRRIGLAIDRSVFRALTMVEAAIGFVVSAILLVAVSAVGAAAFCLAAVVVLLVQVAFVRPMLTSRAEAVLAAENAAEQPVFATFVVYNAFEVLKLAALVVSGVTLYRS